MTGRFFTILIFLQFNTIVFCQNDSTKSSFTPALTFSSGYLMPIFSNVPKNTLPIFITGQMFWQTKGKDIWHREYNFPRIGFECTFSSYGNKNELGYSVSTIPCLQLVKSRKNITRLLKFGLGVGYFNKPYDAISNPTNFYIGSHFANMTTVAITWEKKIDQFNLLFGANAAHCSNGHVGLPNAGLNLLMGHIGIRFNNQKNIPSKTIDTSQRIIKKNSMALKLSIGTHEFGATSKPVGGPVYPSYHFAVNSNSSVGKIHVIQGGIVYSYYVSFYDYIKSQQFYTERTKFRSSTIVATLGHEFIFGKFSFSSILGIYLYNRFYIDHKKAYGEWKGFGQKLQAWNTNRLGIIYYPFKKANTLNNIQKQLALGVFIKANLGQADMFEYSISYNF